jgi:integrase/recombinase XerD
MFHQRLTGQSIANLVKKHARAAGLSKNVSSHSLRHACATHVLRGGADIIRIQAILGHRFL